VSIVVYPVPSYSACLNDTLPFDSQSFWDRFGPDAFITEVNDFVAAVLDDTGKPFGHVVQSLDG
jgi:cytolysin (calcineurin-like family phosphatase)